MWSLPDINKLNAHAAARARQLRTEAARKRKPDCEIYGCVQRAEQSTLWFDIFSDDPKGVIHTCPDHGWADDPDLFFCENCERVMVDHYTWERYQVEMNGDALCLSCAAKRYFDESRNWIDPRNVTAVVFDQRELRFDSANGSLDVARCLHVLGVKQPLPEGVVFHDNAEFDSQDGRQISGENLLEVIQRLDQPFCPVLDAAYQFAVSIGIYVRANAKSAEGERAAA
jgi:hypothetical protein